MDLSLLDVQRAIQLYTCEEQSEWKDWMDSVFNEQGVYRDPFVGAAGHTSTDLASMSMSKSRDPTVRLEAVRNRRRPNRFGWRYPEDYEPVGVDKDGNTYNNSEPTHVSGECFRAGSSYFIRHDLRYQDPYLRLMVSIHFMQGINGSNRLLVVTPEDQVFELGSRSSRP